MKTVWLMLLVLAALTLWPIAPACAQDVDTQPSVQAEAEPEVQAPVETDAKALDIVETVPHVVAEVNGTPIGRDRLIALAVGVYGRQALETLISQELIRQEAARESVTATSEEIEALVALRVEEQLRALAGRTGFTKVEDLAKLMEGSGRSMETLRTEAEEAYRPFAKSEVLMRKLLEKSISISDAQVRSAFDMQFGAKAELLQIVVKTSEEAESVLKKLEMGADFSELARSVSIDPASRNQGGAVPLQPENSPLGKPAFALKPSQVSAALPLGERVHILKLVSIIPANDNIQFDDVKEVLRKHLLDQALAQGQQQWLAEKFKEAKIQRNL